MQEHIPMKAIDLELRVRGALYTRLSLEQLQSMCAGEMLENDLSDTLESIAYDVTPRIAYPQTPGEVVRQLSELALDDHTLMTGLPVYIAGSPDRQHALLPAIPLKVLYVNVLDRAIRFGLDELERLAGLDAVLSERARTLLWAMEKAYVAKGTSGGFWMRTVLECLGLPLSWEAEREATGQVLVELLDLGLIKLRGSKAEIYDLTMEVKVPLVAKHRLWEKWEEYDRDKEAIVFAQTPGSTTVRKSI